MSDIYEIVGDDWCTMLADVNDRPVIPYCHLADTCTRLVSHKAAATLTITGQRQ